jgi:hypothetical protein
MIVNGNTFRVSVVTSRLTAASPDGDPAPPGHSWLEIEMRVTAMQRAGLADVGWLDNAVHMYANAGATGQSCVRASVFADLCNLEVDVTENTGGRPGIPFLDTSLRPSQSQLLWAYTSDVTKSTSARDVTVTLAPLVSAVSFRARVVRSSDAPSGQVALNVGGPPLKLGPPVHEL